jgi:hypothetical protein
LRTSESIAFSLQRNNPEPFPCTDKRGSEWWYQNLKEYFDKAAMVWDSDSDRARIATAITNTMIPACYDLFDDHRIVKRPAGIPVGLLIPYQSAGQEIP